jgi:hypothetical protein
MVFGTTELTGLSQDLAPLIANVLLLFITGLVGLASRNVLHWLKANTTLKQQDTLVEFALAAVKAAEGMGLTGEIESKKEYAENIVTKMLADAGISLSAQQIEAAIEAAVYEEFNLYKASVKPTPPVTEAPATTQDGDDRP